MTNLNAEPDESPSIQQLLNALSVEANRMILSVLNEPMTAAELAKRCNISRSTVYRKVNTLSNAGLLEEHFAVDTTRGKCRVYERNIEHVSISVGDDGQLTVRVKRPERSPDEEKTWRAGED